MEEKVNPWKANFTNGLILGLAGIVFSLILWFLDLSLNQNLGYLFLFISAFIAYYFIKSYRDNYLHGRITYGQSVGAGVIIYFYYAIIMAIFIYILHKFIDPGLTDKMLAMAEEKVRASGRVQEEQMEMVMNMQKKFMSPEVMAMATILYTMLSGTIISLIVSIFTRKEGNPLLDPTETK